jgi:hypothetical protein
VTICIGVICDDGKKAIAIADRMVTDEEYLAVKFEHLIPKIDVLSDNCVAMMAGDALDPWEYLEQIKSRIGGQRRLPIAQILEYAKEEFVKLRNKRVNESIFYKRELTLKDFYKNQANLDSELVGILDQMVDECALGIDILLVGVDEDGAQIHYIVDPGTSKCFNNLGYVSTGIGDRHSDITFVDSKYTSKLPFKQALYLAYKAKRRAESAPGVGDKFTDIYVISRNCKVVSEATINKLRQIYEKELALGKSEEINKSIDEMEINYIGREQDARKQE